MVPTTPLPEHDDLVRLMHGILERLGASVPSGRGHRALTPITGRPLMELTPSSPDQVAAAVERAHDQFVEWRMVPAPRRGELVRVLGDLLRHHKDDLGTLVSLETGKIVAEGLGEVQEMIDICDFAVGLSRQLYGLTIATERPGHRMMETWHPLGVCGVITAFNFPVAVWAWNTAVALVCGDPVVWKPSDRAPLTALACRALVDQAAAQTGAPAGLVQVVNGDAAVGEALADDRRVALVSATGSTRMGREVGPRVAARFGRCLLELGGNNGAIVTRSADLDLATRATVFAAAGTAGQRCTTLRRVIAHRSILDELVERIAAAYQSLTVGDPLLDQTLVGPLISVEAGRAMQSALDRARDDGGTVAAGGERVLDSDAPDAWYATPAIVRMPEQTKLMEEETFAAVLYAVPYDDLDEAIAIHNAVPQGLASSIFTTDLREAERFLAPDGSDCGIVNVNIGPSGAEIGGAFGGEKETGGGRESGSDAWKAYMRRATNTINYSDDLPLAQGVRFDPGT